jgi:hypothetical protein
MCDANNKMGMVQCKIYSHIEGTKKMLVLKLDSLIKQSSLRKCLLARPKNYNWGIFCLLLMFMWKMKRFVELHGNSMLFINYKWWEARRRRRKKCAICYIVAPAQIRSFDDRFWRVQATFPIFEGGELPLKALEWFDWLDNGQGYAPSCVAHHQSWGR